MTQLPMNYKPLPSTLDAVKKIIWNRPLPPHTIHRMLGELGIHISEAAVTARIRDLKKQKYGAFPVKKVPNGKGYYDYMIAA